MQRKAIIIILLCLPFSVLFAQQHMQRARELFEFTLAGQGDSIHVRLNDDVRKAIAPEVFSQTLRQLEKQFGNYQSHGDWQTDTAGNITIYYTDVQFEKYALRFITAFDADGKANTIRFTPVPAPKKLSLPVLILQGERDYQVTMEDYGLWRFGLFRNSNVAFKSYPSLNHLFHEGSGKATPFEYNKEAYIPGYVLDDIARWINDKTSITR